MQNVLRISLLALILGFSFLHFPSCFGQTAASKPAMALPEMRTVRSKFPLYLSKVSGSPDQQGIPTAKVRNRIREEVLQFYFEEQGLDSTESIMKLRDAYIATVFIPEKDWDFYLVILQWVASRLDARLIIYDKVRKRFHPAVVGLNIWAMYDYDGKTHRFVPSKLKDMFMPKLPELSMEDIDCDGDLEIKTTRLYHNGTSNSVQTTWYSVDMECADTVEFIDQWIDPMR